jgi:hypothetical protein
MEFTVWCTLFQDKEFGNWRDHVLRKYTPIIGPFIRSRLNRAEWCLLEPMSVLELVPVLLLMPVFLKTYTLPQSPASPHAGDALLEVTTK